MLHDPGRESTRPARYRAPSDIHSIGLSDLLAYCNRSMPDQYTDLFRREGEAEPEVFWAGNLELLKQPSVSVIGAREASPEGRSRATRIARELAKAGANIVSGLAAGIDTAAHLGAMSVGGPTAAVIGTPIDKVYPSENASLQEEIAAQYLLISQFPQGTKTYPSDFPKRNRLMAALTDASIIVEASDTSGTLHQAKECVRLGRWLFIMRSVVEDTRLSWPERFLREPMVRVLTEPKDVFSALRLA